MSVAQLLIFTLTIIAANLSPSTGRAGSLFAMGSNESRGTDALTGSNIAACVIAANTFLATVETIGTVGAFFLAIFPQISEAARASPVETVAVGSVVTATPLAAVFSVEVIWTGLLAVRTCPPFRAEAVTVDGGAGASIFAVTLSQAVLAKCAHFTCLFTHCARVTLRTCTRSRNMVAVGSILATADVPTFVAILPGFTRLAAVNSLPTWLTSAISTNRVASCSILARTVCFAVLSPLGILATLFASGAHKTRWTVALSVRGVTGCSVVTVTLLGAVQPVSSISTFFLAKLSDMSRTACALSRPRVTRGPIFAQALLTTVASVESDWARVGTGRSGPSIRTGAGTIGWITGATVLADTLARAQIAISARRTYFFA